MTSSNDPGADPPSVVVVGVDFSETSLYALQTAENLARAAPNAELHLLHACVMPTLPPDPQELFGRAQDVFANRLAKAKDELDRLAGSATHGIARVTGHLRIGSPAVEIVDLASDIGADLIVVGTDHRTGVSRLVFGSVSEKVARTAPCPVLIVRPKAARLDQIEPPCPDCAHVQEVSRGTTLWCERHSQHHPRPHTYHEIPANYGIGSMTFRD